MEGKIATGNKYFLVSTPLTCPRLYMFCDPFSLYSFSHAEKLCCDGEGLEIIDLVSGCVDENSEVIDLLSNDEDCIEADTNSEAIDLLSDDGECVKAVCSPTMSDPWTAEQKPAADVLSNVMSSNNVFHSNTTVLNLGRKRKAGDNTDELGPTYKALQKTPLMLGNKPLQAGVVQEEDVTISPDEMAVLSVDSYVRQQTERLCSSLHPILFHDEDFETVPTSIDGATKKVEERCRCSPAQPAIMSFSKKVGHQFGRPYFHCKRRKCKVSNQLWD